MTISPTTIAVFGASGATGLALCEQALDKAGLRKSMMIDCSHANSNKDPKLQPLVMADIGNQILEGNKSIVGLMVESNLNWGNQKIPANLKDLKYGVSVTDACVDWSTTATMIKEFRRKVKEKIKRDKAP